MGRASGKALVEMIAERAGVSLAAAYASLSPRGPGKIGVRKEKRDLVLSAARELGYVRNEVASSLVTGRTETIGVCVQSIRDNFFSDFFSVLDAKAFSKGYTVMIASSDFDATRELRSLKSFIAKRVDALIVACSDLDNSKETLQDFRRDGGKVVLLDSNPVAGIPNVSFNESLASQLQAECLWKLGHRRVAFVGAMASKDAIKILHGDRARHFSESWKALSGEEPETISFESQFYPDPTSLENLARKAKEGRISALACASDSLAMGLISSLSAAGIEIPAALSVIGLDGLESGAAFFIPLSTVKLPTEALAEETWSLLDRMLFKSWSVESEHTVSIKPELFERASSAPPCQAKRGRKI